MLPAVQALDVGKPDAAQTLEQQIPFKGPAVARVRDLCRRGLAEGWLAPKSGGPKVKFGRLAKDMGVKAVTPLDGITKGDLQGAQLALIIGG